MVFFSDQKSETLLVPYYIKHGLVEILLLKTEFFSEKPQIFSKKPQVFLEKNSVYSVYSAYSDMMI